MEAGFWLKHFQYGVIAGLDIISAYSNLFIVICKSNKNASDFQVCEQKSTDIPHENIPSILLWAGRVSPCSHICKCAPAFNKPQSAYVSELHAKFAW